MAVGDLDKLESVDWTCSRECFQRESIAFTRGPWVTVAVTISVRLQCRWGWRELTFLPYSSRHLLQPLSGLYGSTPWQLHSASAAFGPAIQ